MKREWIRPFFIVAALYDFVLGVGFLFAWSAIYAQFGVTPRNHPAYIQFAAAVVAIFGVGFWFVAQAPERNRDIIKLGVLLKLAYAGTVPSYWAQGRMPSMWVPFAWIDLGSTLAFIAALRALPAAGATRAARKKRSPLASTSQIAMSGANDFAGGENSGSGFPTRNPAWVPADDHWVSDAPIPSGSGRESSAPARRPRRRGDAPRSPGRPRRTRTAGPSGDQAGVCAKSSVKVSRVSVTRSRSSTRISPLLPLSPPIR